MGSRGGEVTSLLWCLHSFFNYCLQKISLGWCLTLYLKLHLFCIFNSERQQWLIRFEFLCHTHPIIKAVLRYYGLPAVSLYICVGLCYCCTSKPLSNTHLHTETHTQLPVHTYSLIQTHTHIQISRCVCWLMKVFIFVFLQENKETRYQEWRPTHTVLRSATPWYINEYKTFYVCFGSDMRTWLPWLIRYMIF